MGVYRKLQGTTDNKPEEKQSQGVGVYRRLKHENNEDDAAYRQGERQLYPEYTTTNSSSLLGGLSETSYSLENMNQLEQPRELESPFMGSFNSTDFLRRQLAPSEAPIPKYTEPVNASNVPTEIDLMRAQARAGGEDYIISREAQGIARPLGAFGAAMGNTASLGMLPMYWKENQPETLQTAKQLEEEYPLASKMGSAAGYLLPATGIGGAVSSIPRLATQAGESALSYLAKKSLTGAITMGTMEGTLRGFESAVKELPPSSIAKEVGKGAASGAIFGGVAGPVSSVLEGVGASILRRAPDVLKNSLTLDIANKFVAGGVGGAAGVVAANQVYEPGKMPDLNNILEGAAFNAFFHGMPGAIESVRKGNSKRLYENTQEFAKEITEMRKVADSSDLNTRVRIYDTISKRLDESLSVLNKNRYVGSNKDVQEIKQVLKYGKRNIDKKIAMIKENVQSETLSGRLLAERGSVQENTSIESPLAVSRGNLITDRTRLLENQVVLPSDIKTPTYMSGTKEPSKDYDTTGKMVESVRPERTNQLPERTNQLPERTNQIRDTAKMGESPLNINIKDMIKPQNTVESAIKLPDKVVKPVEIDRNLVSSSDDFGQAFKEVKEWILKKAFRGEITNNDTGWNIRVSRVGYEDTISHTRRNKDLETLKALGGIESLIRNAILFDNEPFKKERAGKRRDVESEHIFYSLANMGDNTYLVKMVVDEMNLQDVAGGRKHKRFYNLRAINIKPTSSLGIGDNAYAYQEPVGSEMSLTRMSELVKQIFGNREQRRGDIVSQNVENINESPFEVRANQTEPVSQGALEPSRNANKLPEKIDDLKKYVKETEKKIKDGYKLIDIDLQRFAEAKKILEKHEAISKFFSNTLKNANFLSDEQKDMFPEEDFKYNVRSEEESLKQAAARLSYDFEGEVKNLKEKDGWTGIDLDAAMGILNYHKVIGKISGDYGDMLAWARVIREKGSTEAGRAVQAHAKYSRSPENSINQAQKIIDDIEKDVKEKQPERIKKIDDGADAVGEVFKKADKKAQAKVADVVARDEDLIRGTPGVKKENIRTPQSQKQKEEREDNAAELLAKKISQNVEKLKNPKASPEKDVIDAMVDELYRKYKETVDPSEVSVDTRYAEIAEAVKNRAIGGDVWMQARKIVAENFKDDPAAGDILDKYFGTGTRPPFSQKLLNRVVTDAMKKLDIKLSDMVKEYFAIGERKRGQLADFIVQKSGLTGDDARVLAGYVHDRIKELKKQYSEEYLAAIFKPKGAKTKDDLKLIRDIEAFVNVGGFDNEKFARMAYDHLSPKLKSLVKKSGLKMDEIVKAGIKNTQFNEDLFVANLMGKLDVNDTDARIVASYAGEVYNRLADEARARALNNLFKEKPTKTKRRVQDKILELIHIGAYSSENVRNLLKEIEGLPVLSNEEVNKIIELSELAANMDRESYLHELTQSTINKIMSDKVPMKFRDKILGLRRISLLSAPVTHVRNITSNILMNTPVIGLENLKDYTSGALIDALTSKVLGTDRTTLFSPITKSVAQVQGGMFGVKRFTTDFFVSRKSKGGLIKFFKKQGLGEEDAKKMAEFFYARKFYEKIAGRYENIDTSKANLHYELQGSKVFDNKLLNIADTAIKTGLRFGDVPFYEASKAMRIAELKKIYKTSTLTDEQKFQAELYALERVFMNNSDMMQRLTKIKSALGVVGDVYIPFTQTPSNIFDKLLDYSGLGIAKGFYELGKTSDKIIGKRLIEGEFNQKLFVDRISRAFTGIGLMYLFMILADMGLITAEEDKRERVRENQKAMGSQRYSLKIAFGGKTYYYSFDGFAPISALIGMAAEYAKEKNKGGNSFKATLAGLEGAGNVMISSSMLRGLLEFTTNFNLFGSFGKTLNNATAQANPTILKRIAATLDPWTRETYDPDPLKQGINKWTANVPILSRNLPAKVDVFGRQVERYGGFNGWFMSLFNPGTVKEYKPTREQKEIWDVFSATDDTGVLPGRVSETITHPAEIAKGVKLPLTTEQFVKLQRLTGEYTEQRLKSRLDSMGDNYKSMAIDKKADLLSKIVRDAASQAKKEIAVKEIGIQKFIEEKKRNKVEEGN